MQPRDLSEHDKGDFTMGLFSKKLTPEQEEEVQEYIDRLRSICVPCVRAWQRFMQDMHELMLICQPAGVSESDPIGVEDLIKPALESANNYRNLLIDGRAEFSTLETKEWFPKNLKYELDSWYLFLVVQLHYIPAVIRSLSPPDPLKMWITDGQSKLNLFIESMDSISTSLQLDVVSKNIANEQ